MIDVTSLTAWAGLAGTVGPALGIMGKKVRDWKVSVDKALAECLARETAGAKNVTIFCHAIDSLSFEIERLDPEPNPKLRAVRILLKGLDLPAIDKKLAGLAARVDGDE